MREAFLSSFTCVVVVELGPPSFRGLSSFACDFVRAMSFGASFLVAWIAHCLVPTLHRRFAAPHHTHDIVSFLVLFPLLDDTSRSRDPPKK